MQKENRVEKRTGFIGGLLNALRDEYFCGTGMSMKPGEAKGESVEHEFDIAQVVHMEKIGDCLVDMRLYANRIARMIKKPCINQRGKQGYERIYMPDFTEVGAANAGMVFSIASCIEVTKSELGGGSSSVPLSTASQPAKQPAQAQSEKTATPVKEANFDGAGPGASFAQASGRVVFAGDNTIHPKGRNPYKTFSVAIRTTEGDVYFSGVDLEKKFRSGEFAIGDLVSLSKSSSEFVSEIGGERKTRIKNEYKVQVLKKA